MSLFDFGALLDQTGTNENFDLKTKERLSRRKLFCDRNHEQRPFRKGTNAYINISDNNFR